MRLFSYINSRWRRKAIAMLALVSVAGLIPSVGAEKTAADYFVRSLPGAPEGIPLLKMHAGHVEITPEHRGNLFFWFFQNRHLADRSRLIIWLNGGPGCSSEDGAMMEIGPYRVEKGGKLSMNNGSWDEFANLLFVDNPVGTGFSYVDTDSFVRELDDMAKQFVMFLEKWFALFPDHSMDDIYIAGESYAGQHIPYIAKAILDRNENTSEKWNIKGLLIGNGWIYGPHQYPSYMRYGYEHGLIKAGTREAQAVEAKQVICDQEISNGGKDHVDNGACEAVLQEILEVTATGSGENRMCYNMYDIRLRDKHPSCGMAWPPDLENVTPYLRQGDVVQALHVNTEKHVGWTECNGAVSNAFRAVNSRPSYDLLPGLLKEMRIVLFSGDQDLICNHLGTEELINNLEFNGGKGMEISRGVWAPRRAWTFEGEPAGFYQEARNLTYILFYNSSHMVPFDYPRRTRDMVDRFMGVDIGSIGGKPTQSLIDGEKGPQTSVGGHPNSTAAEEEQGKKLKEAEWKAYYKSGEVALIVVAIAAAAWAYFIWRSRRRRAGYLGVFENDPEDGPGGGAVSGMRLEGFRNRRGKTGGASGLGDLEAADFDESELDDLGEGSANGGMTDRDHEMRRERYSLGEASDTDSEKTEKQANGHGLRSINDSTATADSPMAPVKTKDNGRIAINGDLCLLTGAEKKKIVVQSAILKNISPVFNAMLRPGFKEGALLKNHIGANPIEIPLPDDDYDAMQILCAILHHRGELVPAKLGPSATLTLTLLAEKYDCLSPLWFFVRGTSWLAVQKLTLKQFYERVETLNELFKLLLATYILKRPTPFGRIVREIVMCHNGPFYSLGLDILEGIMSGKALAILEHLRSRAHHKVLARASNANHLGHCDSLKAQIDMAVVTPQFEISDLEEFVRRDLAESIARLSLDSDW